MEVEYVKKVESLEIQVKENTEDITKLKIADATIFTEVKNLVKSVDNLVNILKWGIGGVLAIILCIVAIVFK